MPLTSGITHNTKHKSCHTEKSEQLPILIMMILKQLIHENRLVTMAAYNNLSKTNLKNERRNCYHYY